MIRAEIYFGTRMRSFRRIIQEFGMNGFPLRKFAIIVPMLSACVACPVMAADQKPNIVVIMADDLGFSDLGCYGSEIDTPNIDRLAKRGLRFTRFYNNAKCAPSRSALLSGLYPHQTSGKRNNAYQNIAQVLKSAGYRTLMTGRAGGLQGTPCKSGFDRFFGLADAGCCNYFNPGRKRPGENEPGRKYAGEQRAWGRDLQVFQPFTPQDKNFYATDAFTNCAVDYLHQYGKNDQPFFLYLPYTAPHFPLHARPEDINKYRGKYKIGWDAVRQQRYKRLVKLGLIDEGWNLPSRDSHVPAWESLDEESQDQADLQMAVYAAMIDRMDQGIGRILDKLRDLNVENNTLVLFLSDNGACAEEDRAFKTTAPNVAPGPLESYRTQGVGWASASNSPFRKYKWWVHEGGVATPLIASWPAVIKGGGQLTHQVGHIMDIMATCVDVSRAESPDSSKQATTLKLEGKSLLPIFEGKQRLGHDALFWQFGHNSAVLQGKWKLVAAHPNRRTGIDHFDLNDASQVARNRRWELYNLQIDRTETRNVAADHAERVKSMSKLFGDWVARMETSTR